MLTPSLQSKDQARHVHGCAPNLTAESSALVSVPARGSLSEFIQLPVIGDGG